MPQEVVSDQYFLSASSGTSLATLNRILKHGGKVFASDLNPLASECSSVPFLRADVSSWIDQVALFKAVEKECGNIDHSFANAGINSRTSLMKNDVDENGDLFPPKLDTVNVDLIGCMYTVKLWIWHLEKNPNGGSVVVTASASSFAAFSATAYGTCKSTQMLGVSGVWFDAEATNDSWPRCGRRGNVIREEFGEVGQ